MHSATLDTAAAILLLSSIGSMGLLVKTTPRSRFSSPTSILSISDILSSVLTALMVFFHHFYVSDDQSWKMKVKEAIHSKYVDKVSQRSSGNYFGLNSTEFSEGDDTREDCDLKSVFFQYALFFIPFINAFLSLLSFSFNCYANAKDVDQRCCKLICAQADPERNVAPEPWEERVDSDRTEKKDIRSKLRQLRGSKIFKQKYKGLALLSQWLLPALFTGTFHLGERRSVEVAPTRPGEDLVCVVAANFPFESCAEELQFEESAAGTSTSAHNYVSSEDNLLWPNPNSSEVDDVLMKVHSVVQAVLNDSDLINSEGESGYFDVAQLLDSVNDTPGTAMKYEVKSNLIQRRTNEHYDSGEGSGSSDEYLKPYLSSGGSLSPETEKMMLNNFQAAECMRRRCVVSVRFLKIYLFLLLVLIYFAPILLSSLLLVVSYYKCREAAKKLNDTKALEDKAVQNGEETPGDEESSKDGWFAAKTEEETVAAEQVEVNKKPSTVEETMCALTCETDKAQSFFRVFKVNAAVAVVLWTPFFFQVISKVFFCSRVPNWVSEVSFLATMLFAVFRNAVNLNIVKMETDAENYRKHNSVHPNR